MQTSAEVDAWFEALDHPLKQAMQRVRQVVLQADPRISETVKWQTPTFIYAGNIVSIRPRAKRFVSLMFHRGSEIPGDHPHLEGDAALVRTMKFTDLDAVEGRAPDLESVVRA